MVDSEQIRSRCRKEIEALGLSPDQETTVIKELSILADLIVDIFVKQKNNKTIC